MQVGKQAIGKKHFFFQKMKNLKKLNHKNKIKYDYQKIKKHISSNSTVDNNNLLHHQNHQNHARAPFTFWCFGSSGDSSQFFCCSRATCEGTARSLSKFGKCS